MIEEFFFALFQLSPSIFEERETAVMRTFLLESLASFIDFVTLFYHFFSIFASAEERGQVLGFRVLIDG